MSDELALDTTNAQDAQLAGKVLELCKLKNATAFGISLRLKPVAHILDGRALESDPMHFAEKVRQRRFSEYCELILAFLLSMRMCKTDRRLIDQTPLGPAEVHYLRITWFGSFFLRLPAFLRRCLFRLLKIARWTFRAFRRYRWIGSIASILVAVAGWLKSHNLSGYILTLALVVGTVCMLLVAWIIQSIDSSE